MSAEPHSMDPPSMEPPSMDPPSMQPPSMQQPPSMEELAGTPGGAAPARHSLTDMPAPWLEQLLEVIGPGGLLGLLTSCRAMRDQVLCKERQSEWLSLDLCLAAQDPAQEEAARAKLLEACRRSTSVKLTLECQGAAGEASARHLMISTVAAAGEPLTSITRVALKGLTLSTLVPAWLTSTCPNMRRLNLGGCHIQGLPDPTLDIPQCPLLKQLEVEVNWPDVLEETTMLKWQHQLRALPRLDSISLAGLDRHAQSVQCVSVIGPQLTHLSFDFFDVNTGNHLQLPRINTGAAYRSNLSPQLVPFFPHISHLQLPRLVVDDQGMEALLNLRSLRKLECVRLQLLRSYHQWPCPWTHLGFSTLDAASLDRLPMEGVRRLSTVQRVIFSPDAAVNARVAAVVTRNVFLSSSGLVLEYPFEGTGLAALIPIVPHWHMTQLLHVSRVRNVNPELLAVIGQHLAYCPHLSHVLFSMVTFTPEAWPALLSSLPRSVRIVSVDFEYKSHVSEAQATEMCVRATHSFMVNIHGCTGHVRWQAGWQERMRVAMAAAGHKRVTLSYG